MRTELIETLQQIPYGEVVEVEQELIMEGLPESEVLKLCDIHGEVLDGHIDQSGAQAIPAGHPVDVFKHENKELRKVLEKTEFLLAELHFITNDNFKEHSLKIQACFNDLIDIGEMLNHAEQPVHEVLSSIKKLGKNEILEILAPFIPAPLLDKSLSLGHKH